jgi:O-antigen/teichoic acid export membrane protein
MFALRRREHLAGQRWMSNVGWAVGDQILSSISNFVLMVLVARATTVEEFGVFALAFSSYVVALGLSRALVTDPFVVQHSGRPAIRIARDVAGAALLTGLAFGALAVGTGFMVGPESAWTFMILGIVLPAALLQDAWRFAFFALGSGGRALMNDAAWAAVSLLAVFTFQLWRSSSLALLGWGLGAAVAALLGALQTRTIPQLRGGALWLRHQRHLGAQYAGEFVMVLAGWQAAIVIVASVAGLAAAGVFRGGQLLLAPFHVLFMGLTIGLVPVGVARARESTGALVRLVWGTSSAVPLVSLAYTALLYAIPDGLGRALLGGLWLESRDLVIPLGLAAAGLGGSLGFIVGVRSLAQASLSSRILVGVLTVLGVMVGAALNDARGAAFGLAFSNLISGPIWWRAFARGLEKAERQGARDEGTAH